MPDFDLDAALAQSSGFLPMSMEGFTPEVTALFEKFWIRFQQETGTTVRDGCLSSIGGDPLDWNFGCNLVCPETWAVEWQRDGRPDNLPRSWSDYPPEFQEWCNNLQRVANWLAVEMKVSTQIRIGYTSYVPGHGVLAYVSGTQRTNSDVQFLPRMPLNR